VPGAQAEQLDAPGAEEVCWKPALHWHTVSATEVHALMKTCVCVAPLHAEQGGHALVCEPAAENVLASQPAIVASDVREQATATRWPGPAAAQAWQVASAEPGLVAKKAPAHTHAEWSLLETACESVQAVQLEDAPVPSKEYVLATAQAVQLAADCKE